MVDDFKVAEPGAGTASRAMTAPASGGFPTPAAGSPGALAHPPAGGAPAAKPAPAKRSGLRRFIVPVLILAALGYGGKTAYDYFVEGRFLVSTDDAYVGADTSIIAAKAMGHLTAVPVVDNQVVHKGDLLAAIDDGDYQNAVDAARARIGTQDATIARFARQIDAQGAIIAQAQAQVASAAAQVKSAEADVERAALEYDRSFKLAQTNFGSQQRLEQATADRDRTVAALAAAKASQASAVAALDGAKANLDVLKAQKDEAARQRNELVTALEMAERNLSFTRVLAPVRRHRRQQGGRGRKPRAARNPADGARAAQRLLRRRQFQGDPARRHQAGAESRCRHRRARRQGGRGRGVVDLARLGIASSPCCRRTTRPAISPRSSSVSRCASPSPRRC